MTGHDLWVRLLKVSMGGLASLVLVLLGHALAGYTTGTERRFAQQEAEIRSLGQEVIDLRVAHARMEASVELGRRDVERANRKLDELLAAAGRRQP